MLEAILLIPSRSLPIDPLGACGPSAEVFGHPQKSLTLARILGTCRALAEVIDFCDLWAGAMVQQGQQE